MFIGKRFRLNKTTLGLDSSGTKPRAVQIPAGSIVEIVGSGETDPMVEINWDSRKLKCLRLTCGNAGTKFRHLVLRPSAHPNDEQALLASHVVGSRKRCRELCSLLARSFAITQ
jgi:hypothetical protein